MPALTLEQDFTLAMTDPEKLLDLDFLQEGEVKDSLHAYLLAKRCNEKRVMVQAVKWSQCNARINAIARALSSHH